MSDALPPSPLITPDLRRQLQQRYEEAQRLAASPTRDFRRVHNLLAECVRADPGNILYLDALLANLRRWQPQRSMFSKWLDRWRAGIRGNEKAAPSAPNAVLSTQYRELSAAPQQLLTRTTDTAWLHQLAAAAADCDFDEVERRYWNLAVETDAGNLQSLRGLALALTRQGRFEQAAAAWERVLTAAPGDERATAALADLDMPGVRKLDDEERALSEAQAAGGPLLQILEQREELQLQRARQRLLVAQRRSEHDPHPKSVALVERMSAEHARLEIEMLHLRCERLPGDWRVRVDLAKRLKTAGNYSGAIQRLEEAGRIESGTAVVAIELGENWQRLRQFAKALEYYRQAIAVASDEDLKLALYRGGTLAAAMGQPDEARGHLTRLVGIDPAYRDARLRLDKLPAS